MVLQKMFFIALMAVVLLFSSVVEASAPAPVCYYRTQKCCYNYTACGYAKKKLERKEDCSYKKCEEKCEDVCYPDKTCSVQRVEDGEDCETVPGEYYGYTIECKTKYATKEVCGVEKKCEKKCSPSCYTVPAKCTKYDYYEYPKYCPTLSCEKIAVSGGTEPTAKDVVADEGEVMKIEEGGRYDK